MRTSALVLLGQRIEVGPLILTRKRLVSPDPQHDVIGVEHELARDPDRFGREECQGADVKRRGEKQHFVECDLTMPALELRNLRLRPAKTAELGEASG